MSTNCAPTISYLTKLWVNVGQTWFQPSYCHQIRRSTSPSLSSVVARHFEQKCQSALNLGPNQRTSKKNSKCVNFGTNSTNFENIFQSALRVYINITSDVDLYNALWKKNILVKLLALCFQLIDGVFKRYYSFLIWELFIFPWWKRKIKRKAMKHFFLFTGEGIDSVVIFFFRKSPWFFVVARMYLWNNFRNDLTNCGNTWGLLLSLIIHNK